MADASTALPAAPKKTRTRVSVSPEIAANVREEDEALAATMATAQAIASAAVAAGNAAIERAQAKRNAAMRPILRQLGLHEGTIVETDGFGDATVLVIELPAIEAPAAEAPHA